MKSAYIPNKNTLNRVNQALDNIVYPSILGVGAEVGTAHMLYDDNPAVASLHTVIDLNTHLILNTINLESKKFHASVNRTVDALVHVLGKYGGHTFYHTIQDKVDSINHHAHAACNHAHHHIDHLQEYAEHTNTVPYITIPIAVCIGTEQLYKWIKSKNSSK